MHIPTTVAAVATASALALTGCGGPQESAPADQAAVQTAANGDEFTATDVTFARTMIPHHAQAIAMVAMADGRTVSPRVRRLMAQIRGAQAPEVETMSQWLRDWGKPVPRTMMDHQAMGHGGMDHGSMDDAQPDHQMPGMMSPHDMQRLEAARSDAFETQWLTMMIEHHEGAVEMARTELKTGTFGPARDLAESIIASQQQEISRMRSLLND